MHALLAFALEPAPGGYTLYWAIHVKPVNRFTPFDMAMIDPFRGRLIYPALIHRFEAAWKGKLEHARPTPPIV